MSFTKSLCGLFLVCVYVCGFSANVRVRGSLWNRKVRMGILWVPKRSNCTRCTHSHIAPATRQKSVMYADFGWVSSYVLKPITHIEPRWVQLKLKFSSHTHKHLGQFENIISVSHSSCVTFPTQTRKNLSKRHHTVGRRRREYAWPLLYAPLSLSFSLRASF